MASSAGHEAGVQSPQPESENAKMIAAMYFMVFAF